MAPPLDGVRVLEAASYVSGPFAGQMLADLGAEVIKLEAPPQGDAFRRFNRPPGLYNPMFANSNRGKHSILADAKDSVTRDALLDLVATCDVWLTNWRPGVADRLGFSDDTLRERNPSLIRVYISGYGPDGPRANAPVFDTIMQATSGLTDALAQGERPTVLAGFPIDKVTAAIAVQAVLAALYARERRPDRHGDRIDLSMLAAAAYNNFVELFANRTFLDDQPADARNRHAIGLRPLAAKDGWITIAPVSGTAIRAMCEIAGHPEWADDLRAMNDQSKVAATLFDRLEPVLPTRTVDEWLGLLAARDVPAAHCLTMDEHLADPQVRLQDLYRIDQWEGIGAVRTVRYPARFDGERLGANGPAPMPGQDNDRYLKGQAPEP